LKGERLENSKRMSINTRRLWLAAASFAAMAATGTLAHAETLADALALAYQSNPTLQSQRALQRQLDESYVQARAGYRPTANVSSSLSWSQRPGPGGGYDDSNSLGATLTASQPIYTGGRVSAAIDVAEANILAGRENLRTVEQTVLLSVIQAYQDVLRDQQIVGIRQQSAEVLASQLAETQARFEVGLLTRTDVARAEAQVAQARAQLSAAQAQLQISRANYTTAVGQNPGELVVPPALPGLPASVDLAFDAAEAGNPNLRRAQLAEQASRYRVAQVRAQNRPTVSLQGSFGYAGTVDPFDLGDYRRSVSVSGVVTQPLFTGGLIRSQVRAALEQNTSDRVLIEQARRTAVQATAQAWNQLQSALANITSGQEQVRAATVAFEGAQEQYRVGLSTTLDVLLTQEQLRTAQLGLVQAQRDAYVAQANLLSAMGRLDARSLVQGVSLYDPQRSFDRVKNEGAVPWEPLVEAVDAIAAPSAADPTRPIPAPPAPEATPALNTAAGVPSTSAGFSTVTPTAPGAAGGPGGQAQRPATPATPAPMGSPAPTPLLIDSTTPPPANAAAPIAPAQPPPGLPPAVDAPAR
jgi:outer membrane protein